MLVAASACSDEPVNYSAPVSINLKAKSDDTQNGVVTTDKGINTESGNLHRVDEVASVADVTEPMQTQLAQCEVAVQTGTV